MKRLILIIVSLCITVLIQAQVSKTINVTAGGLSTTLTPAELSSVTNLTLTGTIDSRDFKTMRDTMTMLAVLDLGGVTIDAYKGLLGTSYDNLPDAIPINAFNNKTSLTSIVLPTSVTVIDMRAFQNCTGLTSITIPISVTSIGISAFNGCTGLTSFTIPISVTSIGVSAFNGCSNLSSIYALRVTPVVLSSTNYVFYNVNTTTCTLYVPYGSTALYAAAIQWNGFKNIVEMPGFGLSSYNIILAAPGTTASVAVVSNVTWTVSCNESWLTVSPTSSAGNDTMMLTVQANPSVATRTAFITISSPGVVSQTLKLTHLGVPKTLDVTAGGLSSALTAYELNNTTRLILTGTIDARDFNTMHNLMPVLAELDISGASIAEYYGSEGTLYWTLFQYSANAVPEGAFNGKTSLKSVILPLSLKAIQNAAFYQCTGLTSVTAPSSVTLIDHYAFSDCSSLTSFDMPSSVTTFGRGAFKNCSLLTSITIPASVTFIGDIAFTGCNALTSIYAYGVTPVFRSDDWGIFSVSNISCTLYVPYGTSALYAAVYPWRYFTKMIELPGFNLSSYKVSIPTAGGTTKVAITSNVTWTASSDKSWLTVNPASFTGNDTLTLSAPANLSVAMRTALVTISSPGVVPQILTVTQVGIPKTLEVTAGGLYSALTATERQTISRLILTGTIDASDFKTIRDRMPSLTELDISGATIAAYSGSYGTFNTNRDYPGNTVPIYAFLNPDTQMGKTSLTSILLPSSSTAIEGWAFYGCTGLTSFTIPSSVTSIGSNVFQSCTGLTSVNIPPSVTVISSGTFQDCYSLTSLTIPSSVTSIGSWAFFDCHNLTSIYTHNVTPVNLSSSIFVFHWINKTTCILHVPYGTSALYAAADQWKDFINIVEIPVAGSIAANQTICSGLIPAPLTSTSAGAGQGRISYRWEYSNNGISWLPTGTSGETYAPDALTQTTMFRRITISTVNGTSWDSAPTEPVTVTVTPDNTITLSSAVGTDTQTLCANTALTNITYFTTSATGATFDGLPDGVTGEWDSNMLIISGMPTVSGTFNYMITLTGGCGSITKAGSIVVNASAVTPTVSISASQNNVDAGTPVTFTATPVDGGTTPTYKWFLNHVARATGATGIYTPKNGDVIYVEMTSSLACVTGNPATSNVITMIVENYPAGSVSISVSQNNVCPGTPVTFTAIPVGGAATPAYTWYLNNINVANGASVTYTPTNGDEVFVMMKTSYPVAKSNLITMVVDPNSAGVPTQPASFTEGKASVYQGQSDVRYTVPFVADVTYIWSYSGAGATITGTSNSVLISFSATASSGILSVRASSSCGISEARSGSITVSSLKAGILARNSALITTELPSEKNELKVYPNPSSGPVTVDFRINENTKVILDIFSSSGMRISRIFEGDVEAGGIQTVILNESLAPGVYIYMLKWKDQEITGKLIINR